jgi:APA family basic amino acid/polyamine antiporter
LLPTAFKPVSALLFRGEAMTAGSSATAESRRGLLRILGTVFGVTAVMGGMVGQGILRTPGIVAASAGTPGIILLLWVVGAVLISISALAYVELGTAIPSAGGPYDFIRRAFGESWGVIAGWAGWFTIVSAMAFLSIVAAEFLHRLNFFPQLSPALIAVALLGLLWGLNSTGTRLSAGSQVLLSAAKGLALLALVVILFAAPAAPVQSAGATSAAVGVLGLAGAMRVIMSTYDGWQDAVYHCEELRRPERTLPRAMAIGIGGVALLYVVVNAALLHVLSPSQIASSKLPAADAIRLKLGSTGDLMMTVFGVLSVAAIAHLYMMRAARVAYAMARNGDLPRMLSNVALSGTPQPALTASVSLAVLLAATGTYETIVAMNVPVTVALVCAVNLAALKLRRKEPHLERAFRIPFYPFPAVVAVGLNLALLIGLVWDDPVHSLLGFALLALLGIVNGVLNPRRGLESKADIRAKPRTSSPRGARSDPSRVDTPD